MTGGELRAAATGDGGGSGSRGCLAEAIGELKRAVGSPVFVPREDGRRCPGCSLRRPCPRRLPHGKPGRTYRSGP